ncbi:MAG: hypothetical protein LBR36_00360 [Bacteroidales bacterium]|jgi:hypothetical protein|nr:hypothetical protein [Bacteroidales bacterium]
MNIIKKGQLNRRLSRFLKQKDRREVKFCSLEDAKRVQLFVTCPSHNMAWELNAVVNKLFQAGKEVQLCCFSNGKTCKSVECKSNLQLSKRDISFFGTLKSRTKKQLQQYRSDIFIDMDMTANIETLFLKTYSNTAFRIGRTSSLSIYYDFIVLCNEKYSLDDFVKNVGIYTKKFKENN